MNPATLTVEMNGLFEWGMEREEEGRGAVALEEPSKGWDQDALAGFNRGEIATAEENGQGSVPLEETSGDWEQDTLARFRSGEVEAFGEFVHHYQDRLYNVIYRMSWDENETRDVLQETFLKAFRSLGNFQGQSKVLTWLHRIAVNTFLNERRKPFGELVDPLTLDEFIPSKGEAFSPRSPTIEEMLEEKEGHTLLENAISALPEEYRAVLVLRDREERSAAEVAEMLDITVPAVKSRLHRARLFVQRELEKLAA